MRNQKRSVSITRTLAGIAEERKNGKVLNNWVASDYRKSENKRDKMFFRRLKNSFKNRTVLMGLTIILLFCFIRRATADEINKILELGPMRVEIIQNKMGDQDAERLLSYSKSLLEEGRNASHAKFFQTYEEAKKILENIKIYNANKNILDDTEYYIGEIHYLFGEKYGTYAYQKHEEADKEKGETLKIYKKMCYLYPKSDVITTGKLARTLVNIIKNETETKEWDERYPEAGPNFAFSTYAFQILKYDYPKESLQQTVLTQAKKYIDKMLDMDIGEDKSELLDRGAGWKKFKNFWGWYHIDDVEKVFGKEVDDFEHKRGEPSGGPYASIHSYGKLKLLWEYRKHYEERKEDIYGAIKKREWDEYWHKTKKGATLRKILNDCTSLDPYSWTRQSSEKDIFE